MHLGTKEKKLLAEVATIGFCRFSANASEVGELISSLRKQQFSVSNTPLKVKQNSEARPNTLSAKYGRAAFPFHTDFAFRSLPPRYILLLNGESASQRPTLVTPIDLLDLSLRKLIRNSIWKLISSHKHYLVSGQFIRNKQAIWRWDCDFLLPINREAQEACRSVPSALAYSAERVVWHRESAVLIDNWRCVHARGEEQSHLELDRALVRYEFWGDARMVI